MLRPNQLVSAILAIWLLSAMAYAQPKPPCGPEPLAPVCHAPPRCIADGWTDGPLLPAGSACPGYGTCTAAGKCLAGKPPINMEGGADAKYVVLAVFYAPPGSSAQGGAKSTADYGNGSTAGSSTTSGSSFKDNLMVSVSESASVGPYSESASAGFGAENDSGSNNEIDLAKSSNLDIKVTGPTVDGIDHDLDVIYLWLNPEITVAQLGNKVSWSLLNANSASTMEIQYVYVAWLKNPSTIPPGVAAALSHAGITAADYATILGRDPFASGATTLDPNRFLSTSTSFPYEPPYAAGGVVPAQTFTITNDYTEKATANSSDSYDLSLSASVGLGFGPFKASLNISNTWTWTNTSSYGTSTESKQTTATTITGPAFGYSGPTNVEVYYDTIWSSFLYVFDSNSTPSSRDRAATVKGAISENGRPAGAEEVLLTMGGRTFRTFTNSQGQYYFFGTPRGSGKLVVRKGAHPITIGMTTLTSNIAL
jgi:hypothetical protein